MIRTVTLIYLAGALATFAFMRAYEKQLGAYEGAAVWPLYWISKGIVAAVACTAPPIWWQPRAHGEAWCGQFYDRGHCRYGCPPARRPT